MDVSCKDKGRLIGSDQVGEDELQSICWNLGDDLVNNITKAYGSIVMSQ